MSTTTSPDSNTLPVPTWPALDNALAALGTEPLTEGNAREHLHPLFSRSLAFDGLYLANHSLGRPLDRAAEDITRAMDLWYTKMDGAWEEWIGAQEAYRAGIARLIGAPKADGEEEGCCIVPKTNAGQGLRAVLNAMPVRRPNVVATRGEFDSIDIILKTYQMRDRASVTWVQPDSEGLYSADDITRRITYATDIVMVSQVFYRTGQVLEDLERVVRAAHDNHAVVVLDTYHSAGVLPLDLDALGVDFAIGGSYKYTRGGAGACWLMVRPRGSAGQRVKRTLDTGWFAKKDVFDYTRRDVPDFADGGDGWLESTPPFLLPYQAMAGLAFTLGLGVERLRAYSLEQQAYFEEQLRAKGVPVVRREPGGGFLMVPDDHAPELCDRLLREHRLSADARGGFVRLCPDVLTTRADMDEAATRLSAALDL